jgi:predicted SnoaL-like aldol condensation-catalyzing enzyme
MPNTNESGNKARVLEAVDALFNRRDYAEAERYWSPRYIQHSAHIKPGREGLFDLIKSLPPTVKYEPGVIVAEGASRVASSWQNLAHPSSSKKR